MASKKNGSVKVELNIPGVRELRKSEEICAVLQEVAERAISGHAGYLITVQPGKTRAQCRIEAHTTLAKLDNLVNNTLLKAISK